MNPIAASLTGAASLAIGACCGFLWMIIFDDWSSPEARNAGLGVVLFLTFGAVMLGYGLWSSRRKPDKPFIVYTRPVRATKGLSGNAHDRRKQRRVIERLAKQDQELANNEKEETPCSDESERR